MEGDARAEREGDRVGGAAGATGGRPAGCQRGSDKVVLVADNSIGARREGSVPCREALEDEVVGDELVRPIAVRAVGIRRESMGYVREGV